LAGSVIAMELSSNLVTREGDKFNPSHIHIHSISRIARDQVILLFVFKTIQDYKQSLGGTSKTRLANSFHMNVNVNVNGNVNVNVNGNGNADANGNANANGNVNANVNGNGNGNGNV
jgi:hypothetical protein